MIHRVKVRFSNTVPQLFLYGQTKRCNFHSPKYLQQLEATPACKHIAYPTAGHWMHVTHAEQVVKDVKEFLKE
jgi:pimeloyl-ACP methyl ester carboxylesterase